MKQIYFVSALASLVFCSNNMQAQFAPPVGSVGTTAMYKDSSAFVGWANASKVIRGYMDISNPINGYANVGDSTSALGVAGTNGVVSLGDGGQCTLQFNLPIMDGPGADFAVFENSFDDAFLELAFVEVSSDGINFFRFPAISNTDSTIQTGSFAYTDATKINNLAGKYRALYGTPFDLADITNNQLLNKNAITHIKVIDVVGCIQNQYCSRDANNNKVNDPWPTAFGSSGFDLDAVGVINNQTTIGINELVFATVKMFPNPVIDYLTISVGSETEFSVCILDVYGKKIKIISQISKLARLDVSDLPNGIYFLKLFSKNQKQTYKFIKS